MFEPLWELPLPMGLFQFLLCPIAQAQATATIIAISAMTPDTGSSSMVSVEHPQISHATKNTIINASCFCVPT